MIKLNKEKATFCILCLLPLLGFLSLGFYSFSVISRVLLIAESGAFLLLFLLNLSLVGGWRRWGAIAVSLISVAITLFYHSGIGVALSFFNLLISVILFNSIALGESKKRFLHLLTALLLLLLYAGSNFGRLYDEITMFDFSGYRINKNMVGMLWLAIFFHAFCCLNLLKTDKRKKLYYLCAATLISAYVIYLSECRSAIISLAVFVGLISLCRVHKGEIPYRHYKIAALVLLFSGLLFTLVYVGLSYRISDITVLGKNLFTGREIVWQSAYGLISESFFFGNGTDVLLNTVEGGKTSSAHNMLLSFWYTLGLIPTLVIALLFVNRSNNKTECKRDRITQLALISSLFICFFESFFADPNLQIFFSLFLISNVCKEEENDPKENTLLLVRRKT